MFFLKKLTDFHITLGSISIIGGFFVFYLGVEIFRTKGLTISSHSLKNHSIQKGMLVNIISPYPYIFWLSVGSPIILRA
ncbi:MAG: LysE family transporter, partial [Deltaproteobacteria bacterium]|nr:LysE family transporter [Deltaproteobacteria bacterium]